LNTQSNNLKTRQKKVFRVTINEDLCKGCDICVDFCPRNVYESSDRINVRGYYQPIIIAQDDCTGCKLCELLCPEMAIVIKEIKK